MGVGNEIWVRAWPLYIFGWAIARDGKDTKEKKRKEKKNPGEGMEEGSCIFGGLVSIACFCVGLAKAAGLFLAVTGDVVSVGVTLCVCVCVCVRVF